MSTHKVLICEIEKIEDHFNADRLSVCKLKGLDWQIITAKNLDGSHRYKLNDQTIYCPVDSVLDVVLESHLFPAGSKIRLEKSRIKSIKIRQLMSQGMIIDINPELESMYPGLSKKKVGEDVATLLNITKYELPDYPTSSSRPDFMKYISIENGKNYPDIFEVGEDVSISIKLHGSSSRFAKLPRQSPKWIRKFKLNWLYNLLIKFKKIKEYEFCIGSRNVQLYENSVVPWYSTNYWIQVAKLYDIENKLELNEELFGEIIGSGIQKNYDYGFTKEPKLFVYDLTRNGVYQPIDKLQQFCLESGFDSVPEIYRGPYSKELIEDLRNRNDHSMDQNVPCREGIVIKSVKETPNRFTGRSICKFISDNYYLNKDKKGKDLLEENTIFN